MNFKQLGAALLIFIMGGCSNASSLLKEPNRPHPAVIPKEIIRESHRTAEIQKELTTALEKKAPREVMVEPIMPAYDPLEDHMVSFSMVDEDLKLVLYSLAQSVGMNLIMDPVVSGEKRLVTLNFQNVSAATVLREISTTRLIRMLFASNRLKNVSMNLIFWIPVRICLLMLEVMSWEPVRRIRRGGSQASSSYPVKGEARETPTIFWNKCFSASFPRGGSIL